METDTRNTLFYDLVSGAKELDFEIIFGWQWQVMEWNGKWPRHVYLGRSMDLASSFFINDNALSPTSTLGILLTGERETMKRTLTISENV